MPDRAENRLIHSALLKVSKQSRENNNKRLANELLFVFDDIPKSQNYKLDFTRWLDRDRSLVHYKPARLWCDLILNEKSPFSLAGSHQGLSILFPMNILFEKYVAVVLRSQLQKDHKLKEQASSKFLVEKHGDDKKRMFQLKPDLLIKKHDLTISVLDTKWKVLNSADTDNKYGISQGDMYQLYAYGKKYMNDGGEMFLIYPESENFNEALPVFNFDEGLRLWAVPFKWATGKNKRDRVEFGINPSWVE